MHRRALAEREQDLETFAQLMTDNFVLINARGEALDREARIAQVREGQTRFEAVSAGERIRMFSGTAIRTRLVARDGGRQVRITSVWVNDGGQWKVASTQVTPVVV